jgi:AcrR family transcriptional regulator
MGGDVERGERTRSGILRSAIDLLGRDGMDGLTASALARKAGVSKANLFHHFGSLEEILLQAFDAVVAPATMAPEGATLRETLEQLGQGSLDATRRAQRLVRAYLALFQRALVEPRYRRRMIAASASARAAIGGSLAAKLAPRTSSEDVDALAHLLCATLDGLALHWLLSKDTDAYQRAYALLVDALAAQQAARTAR